MSYANDALNEDALDAIDAALVRSLDAKAGFEKMLEKAEPEFKPVAEKFFNLHASHASVLSEMVSSAGREPDTDGSVMSKINKGVVALRAFLDEIDEDVMDNVRSGEEHVCEAFNDALKQAPASSATHTDLARMKGELDALLAQTRHLD